MIHKSKKIGILKQNLSQTLNKDQIDYLKKKPYVLGIDPGLSGAICIMDILNREIVKMIDLPTFKTPTKQLKGGFFRHLNSSKIAYIIDHFSKKTLFCVIEDVKSAPNQGVSSTFRFGQSYGVLEGIVSANYIPVHKVRPNMWKPALGLNYSKEKSLNKAIELHPEDKDLFKLKKYHDRSEACLLCHYGILYLIHAFI